MRDGNVKVEGYEMRLKFSGKSGSRAAIGFFFFQAEDGIRDIGVTGVQTCALPISVIAKRSRPRKSTRTGALKQVKPRTSISIGRTSDLFEELAEDAQCVLRDLGLEIGRASCRERV